MIGLAFAALVLALFVLEALQPCPMAMYDEDEDQ